jgi:two-component system, LytTR family, sensor kinase
MPKFFSKYHFDHILGFLFVYVVVFTSYRRLGYSNAVAGTWRPYLMGFAFVLAIAIPLYFSRLYLLPVLLYKKKNRKFVVSFILTIILSTAILYMVTFLVLDNGTKAFRSLIFDPISITFNFLFFVAFPSITGVAFRILTEQINTKIAYEQSLKEKKQAELDYLKSQLNPHFLFNAINTVYFQVDESVPAAKKTMETFSEMLRYQLYECNEDNIPIEKEINYIQNYISLQLLRRDDNYKVNFNYAGVIDFGIAPLLLIPLVENAFKYWSSYSDMDNIITISISTDSGYFNFEVQNTTETGKENKLTDNAGIGLANVRKRLSLIYPASHKLVISESENNYKIMLTIKI